MPEEGNKDAMKTPATPEKPNNNKADRPVSVNIPLVNEVQLTAATGGAELSCYRCTVPFGVVVLIAGIVVTAVAYSFNSHGSTISYFGLVLLSAGLVLLASSAVCWKVRMERKKERRRESQTALVANQRSIFSWSNQSSCSDGIWTTPQKKRLHYEGVICWACGELGTKPDVSQLKWITAGQESGGSVCRWMSLMAKGGSSKPMETPEQWFMLCLIIHKLQTVITHCTQFMHCQRYWHKDNMFWQKIMQISSHNRWMSKDCKAPFVVTFCWGLFQSHLQLKGYQFFVHLYHRGGYALVTEVKQ